MLQNNLLVLILQLCSRSLLSGVIVLYIDLCVWVCVSHHVKIRAADWVLLSDYACSSPVAPNNNKPQITTRHNECIWTLTLVQEWDVCFITVCNAAWFQLPFCTHTLAHNCTLVFWFLYRSIHVDITIWSKNLCIRSLFYSSVAKCMLYLLWCWMKQSHTCSLTTLSYRSFRLFSGLFYSDWMLCRRFWSQTALL